MYVLKVVAEEIVGMVKLVGKRITAPSSTPVVLARPQSLLPPYMPESAWAYLWSLARW